MKPGAKFAAGAAVIVASVAIMVVEGIRSTGSYFFTPTELITHVDHDSHYYNKGLKVSAKVVPGSIRRDNARQQIAFSISDGTDSFPVVYHGSLTNIPDTFTDANNIDVVVTGSLGRDGVFRATDVIAKCGSRYQAAWPGQTRAT